ncbi:MAG: hypothetical protein M3P96_06100 [Actinomycetota bacterium]|nr:hypothetical protein [Actinomycetota bacterium]
MSARLLLGAVGAAVAAYGVAGLLLNAASTAPPRTALWLVAVVIAHDLVLAPVVALVGWLLVRLVPAWARGTVQGGLVVAGVVLLLSVPLLIRQDAGNYPSLLPLNYRANLLGVLAVVATGTALGLALAAVRRWRAMTG